MSFAKRSTRAANSRIAAAGFLPMPSTCWDVSGDGEQRLAMRAREFREPFQRRFADARVGVLTTRKNASSSDGLLSNRRYAMTSFDFLTLEKLRRR